MGRCSCLRPLWVYKDTLIIFLAPALFCPVMIADPSDAGKCAYVVFLMATYWVTEALPMAVTALLPIVLFPLLGVVGSKQVTSNYLKDISMVFMGALIVAVAVEKWNLHKRIALRVLLTVGSQPKWLLFGFMAATGFISMWITNTAVTAMMIPIAQAVLVELEAHIRAGIGIEGTEMMQAAQEEAEVGDDAENPHAAEAHDHVKAMEEKYNLEEMRAKVSKGDCMDLPAITGSREEIEAKLTQLKGFGKSLCIACACASNIGGLGTLTGSAPNMIFKGHVDLVYGDDTGLTYTSWFIFAFPNVVVMIFLGWICLTIQFCGIKEMCTWGRKNTDVDNLASKIIQREYRKLGPMSFAEIWVLVHFIALVLLWVTKDPGFVEGWDYFLVDGYFTDAGVAMTICISLFIFPSKMPSFLCCGKRSEKITSSESLLDWPRVQHNVAWGLILLIGGGFALADGCNRSGLSDKIADYLMEFKDFPDWTIVMLLSVFAATLTEITSNQAATTIFLPIVAELANALRVNPLYLMLPVAMSAQFAFMLPVANPPNAVVFAYGRLKIIDMVKSGIWLNLLGVVMVQISINTYAFAYFDLGEWPDWAEAVMPTPNDTVAAIVDATTATATFLGNTTMV